VRLKRNLRMSTSWARGVLATTLKTGAGLWVDF
jgi:hypothetical protein